MPITDGRRSATARRCAATATCTRTWSDGGAEIEAMARTAIGLGHEYMVLTDHSAAPDDRPRPQTGSAWSASSPTSPRSTTELGAVPHPHRHRGRHPRGRRARPRRRPARPARRRRRQRALASCAWSAQQMTERMVRGRRQPARRHPRPLHRADDRQARRRRRSTPTTCSRRAPSSTPRSRSTAAPSGSTRRGQLLAAGHRLRLLVLDRHRRPRHRPARVAAARLRPGRRARGAARPGDQHDGRPTTCWPGPRRPVTVADPGPLLGKGRSADVYDIGGGRVLRRYRPGGGRRRQVVEREALVMRHLAAHGFPVPAVFDADGADLVMERLDGRTMLDRPRAAAVAPRPPRRRCGPTCTAGSPTFPVGDLVERGRAGPLRAARRRSSTSTSTPTTSC